MTLAELEQTCRAILNSGALSSSATPTSGDDPKYPDDQIERAVKAAIAKVLGEIAANPKDPRRVSMLVTSDAMAATPLSGPPLDLTSDLKVATVAKEHIGPLGAAIITIGSETRIAMPDFADAVERRLKNTLGLQQNVFYYALEGEFLRHTGTTIKVQFVPKDAITDATNLQGDTDIDVIAYALAILFPFEGGKIEAATHYRALAQQAVQERKQTESASTNTSPTPPSFDFPVA